MNSTGPGAEQLKTDRPTRRWADELIDQLSRVSLDAEGSKSRPRGKGEAGAWTCPPALGLSCCVHHGTAAHTRSAELKDVHFLPKGKTEIHTIFFTIHIFPALIHDYRFDGIKITIVPSECWRSDCSKIRVLVRAGDSREEWTLARTVSAGRQHSWACDPALHSLISRLYFLGCLCFCCYSTFSDSPGSLS